MKRNIKIYINIIIQWMEMALILTTVFEKTYSRYMNTGLKDLFALKI